MSTSVVGGLWGLAMPSNLAPGPLTCLEVCCQVQTNDMRLQSVTPFTKGAAAGTCRGEWPHRVDMRGSAGVLGPDLVLKCSYGLTYHNQVEKYVGQRPSGESQRPRSSGQPG